MNNRKINDGFQANKDGKLPNHRNNGYQPKKVPVPAAPTKGSSAVQIKPQKNRFTFYNYLGY